MSFRMPTHRPPSHPGRILQTLFLDELGMTQRELAEGIKTSSQRINDLVNGRRGITPSTALRLARFFDTTPDFWMNMQLRWDLYETQREEKEVLATIKKFPTLAQQQPAAAD